jgi:hypothetical protein
MKNLRIAVAVPKIIRLATHGELAPTRAEHRRIRQ